MNTAFSQCIMENSFLDTIEVIGIEYSEESHSYGQSFISDCNGHIEYFEISFSTQEGNFGVDTVEIFNGTDINSTSIYTQTYDQEVIVFNTGESFRFVFEDDILLLEGNTYTILVTTYRNSSFLISDTDNYNSGSAIIDGAFDANKDLLFEVLLSDPDNNCNQGNEYIMPDATNLVSGSGSSTNLSFLPISVSNEGSLTGLGYTGLNSSGQLRMALYDDLNNEPNELLAETGIVNFNFGLEIIPVTSPITLSPGNYWIAYAINASSGTLLWRVDSDEPFYDRYLIALDSFEDDLPNTYADGYLITSDTQYPIFAEISCNLLNVDEFEYQKVKIYPNPTTEKLYFNGFTKDVKYKIYSLIGKRILAGTITANSIIDVSNLNLGMYIIRLENGFTYKFIKE